MRKILNLIYKTLKDNIKEVGKDSECLLAYTLPIENERKERHYEVRLTFGFVLVKKNHDRKLRHFNQSILQNMC